MKKLIATRPRYRSSSDAGADDSALTLPPGWLPSRLGDTGLYVNGLAFKPGDWGSTGRPIIRIQNLSGLSRQFNYTEREVEPDNRVADGDLLVSWSATLDTFVWTGPEGVLNQHIFKVIPNSAAVTSGFLYWLLKHEVRALADSQHAHGLAMMHINRAPFLAHPVALPPLDEQKRIVAKLAELMAVCDQLEAVQREREQRRDRLVASSLQRLNEPAEEAAEFRNDVAFYLSAIHRMTARADQIPALRQTILTLAFRGELVNQRAAEGGAERLLQSLRSVHPPNRQFGGRGNLSVDPMACPGLGPVPPSWRWSFLDFLCEQIADVDHKMPKAVITGVPFISARDLKDDGTIDIENAKRISEDDYRLLSRRVQMRRGDIVYSRIGTIGKARLVATDSQFIISYSCCVIRPLVPHVATTYLQRFLESRVALDQAHKSTQGIGVPDLGLGEIKRFQVPLPPLAEQQRIITKVAELMTMCDELEQCLARSEAERIGLLEAVLAKALSGGGPP